MSLFCKLKMQIARNETTAGDDDDDDRDGMV